MKSFKFVKPKDNQVKDPDWFKKMLQEGCKGSYEADPADAAATEDKVAAQVNPRTGLTKEDEKRINQEMIPRFKQQQEELEPEFDHLKNIRK